MRIRLPSFLRSDIVLRLVLLAALAFTASRIVAPVAVPLESGELRLRFRPAIPGGSTILSLGPFGELTWDTHAAPLDIEASFLLRGRVGDFPNALELSDLRARVLAQKMPWLFASGALIALIVVGGSMRRRLVAAGLGAGGFAAIASVVLVASALTFEPRALNRPTYRGPIQDAPRVLRLVEEVRRDWAGVRRNINKVVEGLQRLHQQVVVRAEPPPEGTYNVLLISDIHNNPIGMMIADELIRRFDVQAVLDAGDFSERGTAIEGELFARFSRFGRPHVIAPGNHEDRAALERVRRIDGVTIFGNDAMEPVRLGPITVLGSAHPNADTVTASAEGEDAEELIPGLCERLRERFFLVRPTVILVHDPDQGECVAAAAEEQQIPIVFAWGHLHRQAYEVRGSVVSVSPGTSGAAGLKTPTVLPYGFSIVSFAPEDGHVTSTCMFLFEGPERLRRASCDLPPAPGEPSPS